MNQKRLWVAATIIAVVVVVGFVLSVPHTTDDVQEPEPVVATVPVVTFTDTFRRGAHAISGSLEVPNACATVSALATLLGDASSTQRISVAITVQTDEGVCLQLTTRKTFETSITAPASLPIEVTVNGSVASTTP